MGNVGAKNWQCAKCADLVKSDKRLFPEKECGLYFKDKQGNVVFFFGVWNVFWEKERSPLCFGVPNSNPIAVQAFRVSYMGNTKEFEKWTMGWVEKRTLESESAIEEIWKQLAPVLEAVVAAGSHSGAEGETVA